MTRAVGNLVSRDMGGNITLSPKALAGLVLSLVIGAGGAGSGLTWVNAGAASTRDAGDDSRTLKIAEDMNRRLSSIESQVADLRERLQRVETQLEFVVERERDPPRGKR